MFVYRLSLPLYVQHGRIREIFQKIFVHNLKALASTLIARSISRLTWDGLLMFASMAMRSRVRSC